MRDPIATNGKAAWGAGIVALIALFGAIAGWLSSVVAPMHLQFTTIEGRLEHIERSQVDTRALDSVKDNLTLMLNSVKENLTFVREHMADTRMITDVKEDIRRIEGDMVTTEEIAAVKEDVTAIKVSMGGDDEREVLDATARGKQDAALNEVETQFRNLDERTARMIEAMEQLRKAFETQLAQLNGMLQKEMEVADKGVLREVEHALELFSVRLQPIERALYKKP